MSNNSRDQGRHDPIYQFFTQSHKISSEAQFIIDSFPDMDSAAVEHIVHQLIAIYTILHSFHDPAGATSVEDIEQLLTLVNEFLLPLENFLAHPPPAPSAHLPRIHTGKPGHCYMHAAGLCFTPTSYQDQFTNSTSYRTLMGLRPDLLFHIPIIISFTVYHYSAPFDISLSISFSLFHILNLEPENSSD